MKRYLYFLSLCFLGLSLLGSCSFSKKEKVGRDLSSQMETLTASILRKESIKYCVSSGELLTSMGGPKRSLLICDNNTKYKILGEGYLTGPFGRRQRIIDKVNDLDGHHVAALSSSDNLFSFKGDDESASYCYGSVKVDYLGYSGKLSCQIYESYSPQHDIEINIKSGNKETVERILLQKYGLSLQGEIDTGWSNSHRVMIFSSSR